MSTSVYLQARELSARGALKTIDHCRGGGQHVRRWMTEQCVLPKHWGSADKTEAEFSWVATLVVRCLLMYLQQTDGSVDA